MFTLHNTSFYLYSFSYIIFSAGAPGYIAYSFPVGVTVWLIKIIIIIIIIIIIAYKLNSKDLPLQGYESTRKQSM